MGVIVDCTTPHAERAAIPQESVLGFAARKTPVTRTNYLTDLLSTIFERGRNVARASDPRPIEDLTSALLAGGGEVSALRIAASILTKYAALSDTEKLSYFSFLADELDIDAGKVEHLARAYRDTPTTAHLQALLAASEPPRQELFRRLNQLDDATARLVELRADLLAMMPDNDRLGRIDLDLLHLLSSWFNRGFLVLRRINWQTPANILEKIIAYEAVHAIDDWNDLRRRLQPADRRCYAYFHPCMPDDPLVFVEVALTRGVPGSIQTVLAEDRPQEDPNALDTAVFYSISNCQKGLRGVSFGNALIKQVAQDLAAEVPELKTFITLSPIPGFSAWLKTSPLATPNIEAALAAADGGDAMPLEPVSAELRRLAAHYLADEKRADGKPSNSVARFHLGNGARIENVHAMADISPKGLSESAGTMVNYLYDLNRVEERSEAYLSKKTVTVSRAIRSLLKSTPKAAAQKV